MWLLPAVGARNEGADADAHEKQGEAMVRASAVRGCISSALLHWLASAWGDPWADTHLGTGRSDGIWLPEAPVLLLPLHMAAPVDPQRLWDPPLLLPSPHCCCCPQTCTGIPSTWEQHECCWSQTSSVPTAATGWSPPALCLPAEPGTDPVSPAMAAGRQLLHQAGKATAAVTDPQDQSPSAMLGFARINRRCRPLAVELLR